MSSPSTEPDEDTRLPGLDHAFRRPELLRRALTHRSFGGPHNERLEFLGDGVLNFVIAEALFHAHPHLPEGDLSRMRARLVRDRTLAEVARELDLGSRLRLGAGELKSGGYLRESILADALEAVIGAVYLDGGFEAAREAVVALMKGRLESLPDAESLKDAKTRLQEYLQGRGLPLPNYRLVGESGADHLRRFTVACEVEPLEVRPEATAGTRRKAEQRAAAQALKLLEGGEGR